MRCNCFLHERLTARVLEEFTEYRSVDVQKMNDLAISNYVEVSVSRSGLTIKNINIIWFSKRLLLNISVVFQMQNIPMLENIRHDSEHTVILWFLSKRKRQMLRWTNF